MLILINLDYTTMITNDLQLFEKLKKVLLYEDSDNFLKTIYEYRHQLNLSNRKGETLLFYACYYGLTEQFFTLLSFGVTITKTINGNSLLHYALYNSNDFLIVSELIKMGVKPLDVNNNNEPAFFYSSNNIFNHYLYTMLTQQKINIESIKDFNNFNILDFSYYHNNMETFLYWKSILNHIDFIPDNTIKLNKLNFCQ